MELFGTFGLNLRVLSFDSATATPAFNADHAQPWSTQAPLQPLAFWQVRARYLLSLFGL